VLQPILPKGLRRVRDYCNKQWMVQRYRQEAQVTDTAYVGDCWCDISNIDRGKAQISDTQLSMLPSIHALYGHTQTTNTVNTHHLTLKMMA
jgi:hypothetical protein